MTKRLSERLEEWGRKAVKGERPDELILAEMHLDAKAIEARLAEAERIIRAYDYAANYESQERILSDAEVQAIEDGRAWLAVLQAAMMGEPVEKFTEKQIMAMRRKLAKLWGQKVDQVTDYEAKHYLRQDRADVAALQGEQT